MLQTPELTEQNLKDYERDGFVVVRNAFNAEDAAKIEQWTVEVAKLPETLAVIGFRRGCRDSRDNFVTQISELSARIC